jgi:hypothetical protein
MEYLILLPGYLYTVKGLLREEKEDYKVYFYFDRKKMKEKNHKA